jgi:plasmid stabilization system protein ParE
MKPGKPLIKISFTYLRNRQEEIKNFINQTNYIVSRIAAQPEMYPSSPESSKIRKAAINKHITLYYRYFSTKKEVILLTFWHNKQDPRKLKY